LLGYQDSNLDKLNQNQLGCQLPHTPSIVKRRKEYLENLALLNGGLKSSDGALLAQQLH
jgi:hypothetical protein